ncbi:hypothetical protein GGTG_05292 [Gaeumannomyces tritici R3-111a-1]|uniref:Heterokaryon incompatibility domain-containing protein n=1 Tax=Gaeumannomyces tritici (strain R3-111a-1) TaxID=644352 RepID=J3NVH7_GAET3|nr:hypothetical protein GGTG_05292 [Gaeumannomyces tritici R3-111a-1]EJT75355.1 hypothetical protein GGTG_05292 [Gaeumannomyces tritici R3-111a-1]
MSRWHKSWCGAEEEGVQVGPGGVPHCLTCLRSPDVVQLLAQLALEHSRLNIPPDEPPGEMNLAWPPTVPYLRSGVEETTAEAGLDVAVSQPPRESSSASTSQPQAAPNTEHPSSVYPQTLRPDQIRLLVLDSRDTPSRAAEADDNWPIHVELKAYNDDDCPEYEAVSYAWGGEDGNSLPCRPVYVGRPWDLLFQTRNCYEMLRLLRPRHGLRFIWVDALCINQSDLEERSQQVAKMAFIYGHALRVVLYLGPDMVAHLPPSSFPTRRKLEDLVPHSAQPPPFPDLHLQDLLGRRYFSRIWVVQELLLAKQVLVRIRDVDFVADHLTSSNLLGRSAWSWADTPAPWLAHVSQGTISPAELLRIGISREASDRRDNVFGVLGLLHPDLRLVPDYSISAVHARIGFVAHCLLKGDAPDVLLHPGSRNATVYPSWVPWPAVGNTAWRPVTSTLDRSWRETLARSHNGMLDIHTINVNDVPPELDVEWHRDAHVDPTTGSLSLQLVRLMAIESTPLKLASSDGFTIMELSKPNSPWRFCLVFQETPHELDLRPGDDHIFILDGDTNPPFDLAPVILVMRRVSKERLGFQLVACCHQVYISCSSGRGLAPIPRPHAPLPHHSFLHSDSLSQILEERQREAFSRLKRIFFWQYGYGLVLLLPTIIATVLVVSNSRWRPFMPAPLVIWALTSFLVYLLSCKYSLESQPGFKRKLDLKFEHKLEDERELECERKLERDRELECERKLERDREPKPAPKDPCLRRSLLEHIRVSSLAREIRKQSALQGPQGHTSTVLEVTPDMASLLRTLRAMQGVLNDERGASPSFVDIVIKERAGATPMVTSFNGVQCVEFHVFLSDLSMMNLLFNVVALAKAPPACLWRRGPVWALGLDAGGPEEDDFHHITVVDMCALFHFVGRKKPGGDAVLAGTKRSLYALLPVEILKECYRKLWPTWFAELRVAGLGRGLTAEGGREDDELSLFLKWASRLPEDEPLPQSAREDPDYKRNVPYWDPDVMEFGVDGSTYRVSIV